MCPSLIRCESSWASFVVAKMTQGQKKDLNGREDTSVLHDVGHDQCQWEKQEAEKEVRKKAVALAAGYPRRPERNDYPDDESDYPEPVPHVLHPFRWVEPATTRLLAILQEKNEPWSGSHCVVQR